MYMCRQCVRVIRTITCYSYYVGKWYIIRATDTMRLYSNDSNFTFCHIHSQHDLPCAVARVCVLRFEYFGNVVTVADVFVSTLVRHANTAYIPLISACCAHLRRFTLRPNMCIIGVDWVINWRYVTPYLISHFQSVFSRNWIQ